MKGNERFISRKGTTPEQKKGAEEYIARIRKSMEEPFEGEYEKSEEEVRFIGRVDKYVAEELYRLGLRFPVEITPKRFHVLSSEAYDRERPADAWPCGFYEPDAGAFVHGDMPLLNIFKTVAHEAVHMASYHAHELVNIKGREKTQFGTYRIGYDISTSSRFQRFNEGVTELITLELLDDHREEMEKEFPVSEKEKEAASIKYYNFEINLLQKIIVGISQRHGEALELVWDRIKRGFFSGHMMHLRGVERVFGPGALIVLAALDDKLPPGLSGDEDQQLTMRFFTTSDEAEKEEIAEKLLSEREKDLEAYKKRLKSWRKRGRGVAKDESS